MIHISNNLYLSDQQSLLGNPIIGYQSILTIDNVSADSDPEETPVINLVNEQTNQFWESGSTDEQYIYFENTGLDQIDYIGIVRHNFGTGQVVYQLQATTADSPEVWIDITQDNLPGDDNAIFHFFDEVDYARLRLRMLPTDTAPMIAHIKLGLALTLPQSIYVGHRPVTLSRKTDVVNLTSENGQFLGRIVKRQYLKTSFDMTHILPDFYRESVDPFVEHSTTGAFFFAWRPVQYPREVGFGWADVDISPENQMSNGMMQFGVSMTAIA
jgi:hypothetical protein